MSASAQLVAVQLLDAGASTVVVVLAALVVNSRMLLYSASLATHTAAWPARWRWLGAYLLADPVSALAMGRAGRDDAVVAVAVSGLPLGLGLLAGAVAAGAVAGGRHG